LLYLSYESKLIIVNIEKKRARVLNTVESLLGEWFPSAIIIFMDENEDSDFRIIGYRKLAKQLVEETNDHLRLPAEIEWDVEDEESWSDAADDDLEDEEV